MELACGFWKGTRSLFAVFALITSGSLVEHMTGTPESNWFKVEGSFIVMFCSAVKNNRLWKNNVCKCLASAK